MESPKKHSIITALPMIFGVIGLAGYCLYFFVRDLPSDSLVFQIILFLPPVMFLAGFITAIVSRKQRNERPAMWLTGIVICGIGLILYILLFALLIYVMTAS